MRIIDQLVYKIDADNSGFNKGVATSEAKAKGFSKAANVAFTALAVGGASLLINKAVQMGREFVDAASDAEETANKFNVTFSDIREEADATAQALSDSFGLSSQKSQQLLSDTGDLLTGFGFTQESALDLSNQVNELAVDLASFTNYSGGAEGASAALTKALLGERESIKSLGIAITEADINRLAEDKGITGELTRQQKAMLTLELATIQSKNAIGDFARSEESLANQQRILEGNLQDLRVELGNKLLPTVTSVVSGFNDLLEGFNANNEIGGRLERTTKQLYQTSKEYQGVVSELDGDISDLTETERIQLELREAQLKQKLTQQIVEQVKEYDNLKRAVSDNNDTIEENNEYLELNQRYFKEQAEELGVSVDRLKEETIAYMNSTAEQKNQISTRDALGATVALYASQLGIMIQKESENNALIAENNLIEKERKAFISESAQAIQGGVVSLENYNYLNSELIDLIKDQVDALEEEEAARKRQAQFREEYADLTKEELILIRNEINLNKEGEHWRERLSAVTAAYNNILAEEAAQAKTAGEAEEKRQEILDNHTEALEQAEALETALGESYDLNTEKAGIYRSTIDALIKSGLAPESEKIKELVAILGTLTETQEENTETTEENLKQHGKYTQEYIDAYRQMYFDDRENFIATTTDKAQAFRDAGMDQAEVAKWVSEQIKQYDEDNAESAKTWAEQHKEAIVEVGNVSTNILNSLGDLYKSQHDARMQQIDEEKAEALESIDEQLQAELERLGLEEDTQIEKLEKRLEKAKETNDQELIDDLETQIARQEVLDEYNQKRIDAEKGFDDERKKIERDAAERQKKIATFEAIINTASGIVEAIPNPFLMATAATVGGLQLAAIQAQPIPSFDVGTLRVPETTQAVVHQDEMILTRNLADQARQEGITISPSGGGGVPAQIMIYLDKRKLGEAMVDEINSGRSYKIDARVVK